MTAYNKHRLSDGDHAERRVGSCDGSTAKTFQSHHKVELIEGDKDLFDDGSLTILSTPRHTLGTGAAVHFQSNWVNRRVPGFNADREKTLASIDKLARIVDDKHAQLWINHDKPLSDARRHAPEFYE